jgi:hydroxyethylthiazole kinase-like uncharacterized protein yjeF
MSVPGAILLPAEAAFRVGAGKVRVATIEPAALLLGIAMPEAAVIGVPGDDEGEIALDSVYLLKDEVSRCDTLVLGPGMSDSRQLPALIAALLDAPRPDLSIVLDAAAISAAGGLAEAIARHQGRVLLTPHHGEMARLLNSSVDAVGTAPEQVARNVANEFNAVVVLKSYETFVVAPADGPVRYASDCIGLATAGSGDVLAGAIGGLLSRGADPVAAAGWGVWLHGEAGRNVSSKIGPIGFVARELASEFPELMARYG